ncbi:hypothetical protein GGS26DRAFT_429210 [Hypomontagnella submonticulosa]|nr:hypothetical protein GGS26DRAFT_429210 [Hypomontagnella submonticulosa]
MQSIFDYFEGAGDSSDTAHSPLDEGLINLPGSWPSLGSSGPLTIRAIESIATTDLEEQLRDAKHKIQDLERTLESSSRAAEKIVAALLQDKNRLQTALERSAVEKENEAREYGKVKETAQILFDELCSSRLGKKCEVRAHQGMTTRLQASIKLTAESIAKEEAQREIASTLSRQLLAANKLVRDERCISRMLSQQVEDMTRLLEVQHAEMKEHKAVVEAQKPLIRILREENDRLQKFERASPASYKDVGVGGGVADIITLEDHARLEKKVLDTVEKSKQLRQHLQQERQMTWMFRDQVDKLENRLIAERAEFEMQTAKLNRLAHALEVTENAIANVFKDGDASDEQIPQNPPSSRPLPKQRSPPRRGRKRRPKSPHPRILNSFQRFVATDDGSPGPSSSAAPVPDSWLFNVTEADEEIPALRLPSPVTSPNASLKRTSQNDRRIEVDTEGERKAGASATTTAEPDPKGSGPGYRPERKANSSMCSTDGSSW